MTFKQAIKKIKSISEFFLALVQKKYRPIVLSQEEWDAQFKKGKWDYVLNNYSPVTSLVGHCCLLHAPHHAPTILDVGCGNGGLIRELRMRIPHIDYYGVDISEEAIRVAQEIHPAGTFTVSDASHTPKFPVLFDIIILSEVLYYVDAVSVLKQYRPLLKENGVLVISMYSTLRTRVVWRLISKFLTTQRAYRVTDKTKNISWDVVVAIYA